MVDNLLISIITVNYNDRSGLERTINSVQCQTHSNFEHIIIDGDSTDGSRELIETNIKNLSYWVSEPDKGIYHAMNKGIKQAKGDFVFFLNSGDILNSSGSLEKIQKHLINKDIVFFNINVKEESKTYIKKCPEKISFTYLHNDIPPHQSTFIRKNLFERFGNYDESLKIVSDWKFLIIALLKHNASYKYVDDTFSTFYAGGVSSIDGSFEAMEQERELVLKKEFPILMNDLEENFRLNRIIRNLRKSKKINFLVKLGLINKF